MLGDFACPHEKSGRAAMRSFRAHVCGHAESHTVLAGVPDCRIAETCNGSFLPVGGTPNPDEDTFKLLRRGLLRGNDIESGWRNSQNLNRVNDFHEWGTNPMIGEIGEQFDSDGVTRKGKVHVRSSAKSWDHGVAVCIFGTAWLAVAA